MLSMEKISLAVSRSLSVLTYIKLVVVYIHTQWKPILAHVGEFKQTNRFSRIKRFFLHRSNYLSEDLLRNN